MSDMLDSVGFEEIVRARAYALWESEGCPAGRDAEHWLRSEEAARRELTPAPAAAPILKAASLKPNAKPASKKKAVSSKVGVAGAAPAYA